MIAPATLPAATAPCDPEEWSVEMLHEMDWRRFREVVQSLVYRQGFSSRLVSEQPDGSTVYGLLPHGCKGSFAALLHLPSWRCPAVNRRMAAELHDMLEQLGVGRGILVTAEHVTFEAREFATEKPLDLLDAWDLLDWITSLPEIDQQQTLRLATTGRSRMPVCPSCGGRMTLHTDAGPQTPVTAGNLVVRENRFVHHPVRCRRLVVKHGVEVHFRRGVVAADVQIEGRVFGQVLCTGRLHIGPQAALIGSVACQRLSLDPGGLLNGHSIILNNSEWAPEAIEGQWFSQPARAWRCASYQPCDVTLEAR